MIFKESDMVDSVEKVSDMNTQSTGMKQHMQMELEQKCLKTRNISDCHESTLVYTYEVVHPNT